MNCTIFKNIYSKDPYYIPVEEAIERIKSGKSRKLIEEIRECVDKEKAGRLKTNLPAICFSGEFRKERTDQSLKKHSGYIVLDFDNIEDVQQKKTEIIGHDFVYACWLSPSGTGIKALIKIANGNKHREHFQALQEIFPDADKSGINVSRVCYESYDPDIYIYPDSRIFAATKMIAAKKEEPSFNEDLIFKKLLAWLINKNDAFVTGERNNFIFKLAASCCRYGIPELTTSKLITQEFLSNAPSDFTRQESDRTIRSAYKLNADKYGTGMFQREILVDKFTRHEIVIDASIYDLSIKPKDVIYGLDVKDGAIDIYTSGFKNVTGIGVKDLDYHFKAKKGEITLLSSIGNYGKSSFKKWFQLMRILQFGEKFATFSPEDNPPEEYYHEFVEILLGCDCTPGNPSRPSRAVYERAYDFISKHIFYVYPKDILPTPDYIKERFLELIIKEKIDGVDIDPFNQMANDYGRSGRTDKYLETFLSDCSRFAQVNNIYFFIIAHPVKLFKEPSGNYPCPDVLDIADGAMWNNKMDNILIYHRPFAQTEPQNPTCEFHSKKIRRQRTVGKKGFFLFEMLFRTRRFFFNGQDPMQPIVAERGLFDAIPSDTNHELPF